jgi:hypothetical protein
MERNSNGALKLIGKQEILVALDGVSALIDSQEPDENAPEDYVSPEASAQIRVEDYISDNISEDDFSNETKMGLDVDQSSIVIKGLKLIACTSLDEQPVAEKMLSDIGEPIPSLEK